MWLLSGTTYRGPGYIALHYIVLVRNYEVRGLWAWGWGVLFGGVALSIILHIPNFVNSIQRTKNNGTTPTAREVTL
jgi:hypothetical protein